MSALTNNPLVEFRDVSFSHTGASAPVISHLNFTVQQGETLVLLGKSGCGKTTTLKLINRLLLPTSGQVQVENKSTTDWDPIRLRRRTGYVIQEGGLFPHFTVERNVGLVPSLENWDPDRIKKRVNELLSLVGLEPDEFAQRYPGELSGGQRQRVGVARALAAEPPLLLLDEPFGALDPLTRASLQREFADLNRRLNKTAVFVTHDVREALLLGSRIGLMDKGQLLLLEPPENFLRSKNELVLAYIETLGVTPTNVASADQNPAEGMA
jgi:osmoprotectant transport system ATP-binding protein